MSIEDGNKEPLTDLSLPLNYHNHGIQLRKNIGAGVNATSKVDTTLVTSHPLSELVWSSHKGISVRSTERGLTEKRSDILWGLRPYNLAVSSTKSISARRSSSDKSMDEKNDITSTCPVNFDVDKVDTPGRVTKSKVIGGLNQSRDEDTRHTTNEVHMQTVYKEREKVGSGTSMDVVAGIGENQLPGLNPYGRVGSSDALSAVPGNASSIAIPSQEGPSTSRQQNVSIALAEQEGKSVLNTAGAITETIDKLEFSAENYLLAEASKRAKMVTLNDLNNSLQEREDIHRVEGSVNNENYRINKKIEAYLRKGKGKALSNGDVNDELADDCNSDGSAGSCNSKMLATSGNTKRGLDQQLIVTSKRLKRGIIRDADSASFIRQSGSFMSWATNMMKGYPGCNPDDAPSSMLAAMLTTHAEHESHSQKPVPCSQEPSGVGFRKLFQLIRCPRDSVEGRKIYLDYLNNEGSGDANNSTMVNVSAVPLAAYGTSDTVPEDTCRLNKLSDQPTFGKNIASPSKQGMVLSNFSTKEINILPRMDTISCNVANGMEIAKSSSSNSSIDKERAHTSHSDFNNTSEEKAAQAIGQKRDYLGSLWITRFRPRISQPASNKLLVTSKFSTNRVLPNSEENGSSGKCLMNVVHMDHSMNILSEGRTGFAKPEGLVVSDQVKEKDEHKPGQSLEVMASVFARRLDALKQVIPFDDTCKPAPMITTCFFCGAIGHDIQACSKITESELEDLFHKIKSNEKVKDPPCLCIKCFQLSHWAIECPQQPSRKSIQGSVVDWSSDIDFYSYRRYKEEKSLLGKDDLSVGTLGPNRTSGGGNLEPDAKLIHLQDSSKLNQDITETRNPLDLGFGGQEAGESSSPHLSTSMPDKISVGMEGVFDAIRRLRLSRSDFLKLMDSQIHPSHLKGYYLRVRLSNCKEGAGEKGYCVACIHGTASSQGCIFKLSGVRTLNT
ncbi:hypothetical protein QQ045_009450 [Rhodiola kirilowii]